MEASNAPICGVGGLNVPHLPSAGRVDRLGTGFSFDGTRGSGWAGSRGEFMSTQVKTMQPREERSPGVPDVYRAISQVTKAISVDGIAKNSKNQQQGYSFRGIDDIYNALSALIAEAELCILPRMISRTQEERQTAK